MIEVSRGEGRGLENEKSHVRRGDREKRADGKVVLSSPGRVDRQRGGCEEREPENHEVERGDMPGDLSERPGRRGSLIRNRPVRAQEIGLAGCVQHSQADRGEADESEQWNEPAEDLERAPEPREQAGGDE